MVLRQSFTTLTKAQRNGSEKTGKWLSIHWQFLILSRAVSIYLCKPRLFSYVVSKKENVLGYAGLVFPSSLGAVSDLANDVSLGALVKKFVANKSTSLLLCSTDHHDISFTYVCSYLEPICAIGYGVAGLCKAFNENDRWCFSGWNLTAVPNSRPKTPTMTPHSHNCYSSDFKLRGSSLSLLLEAASYHRRLCKGPRRILQLYNKFAATSCANHFPIRQQCR